MRHIIATDFPNLLPFTDMLYASKGQTMVKLKDGSWEIISAEEGFSQGCPISPILAGIVLNHVLRILDKLLKRWAYNRHRKNVGYETPSDDGQGSILTILGYMDAVSALVHIGDAAFFVEHFKKLGLPLGAELNQEKTRVRTSATGRKLTMTLMNSNDPQLQQTGR